MSATIDELIHRLNIERDKLNAYFLSLSPEMWFLVAYSENNPWMIRDVLAHFVSAEHEFLKLFIHVVAGGRGTPEDFSIDSFNAQEVSSMKAESPESLLSEFLAARNRMIAWVASLDPSDLEKKGQHPFLGEITVGEMVKMVTLHNHLHYRDLKKITHTEDG